MKNKEIVLEKPGRFFQRSVEIDDELKEGEVLLKVHRVGICGTDLHAFHGDQPFFSYPRILGHELGVEVIRAASDVKNVKPGDKCSVVPYFNTKEGQASRMSKPNCSEYISVFGVHEDGGMRDYIKVNQKYLVVSSKLEYDQLALVETLAIGCHAVNRARLISDDLVLVVGAGPIGLSVIEFAQLKGCKVVPLDISESRLKFCNDRMQVHSTINGKGVNVIKELRILFNGDLPTVVFDATGNVNSMHKSLEYVSHGGTIVFIGLFQGDFTFHDPLFHKKEISLLASRNSLREDFDQIIDLIEKGVIDTNPWITHRLLKDKLPGEFASLLNPENKVIKAMVDFD